jgi:hypothetical protein
MGHGISDPVLLEVTNGDVRAVQKSLRHRDLRVLSRRNDNRQDRTGKTQPHLYRVG